MYIVEMSYETGKHHAEYIVAPSMKGAIGPLAESQAYGVGGYCAADDQRLIELIVESARPLVDTCDQPLKNIFLAHTLQHSVLSDVHDTIGQIAERLGLSGVGGVACNHLNCASLLALQREIEFGYECGSLEGSCLMIAADKVLSEPTRCMDGLAVESDGACASLINQHDGTVEVLASRVAVNSKYFRGYTISETSSGAASVISLVRLFKTTLSELSIELDQVSWIVPHNGNPNVWLSVCRALGIGTEHLFLDNLNRGHFFGADGLMNLNDLIRSARVSAGDIVCTGVIAFGKAYGVGVYRIV